MRLSAIVFPCVGMLTSVIPVPFPEKEEAVTIPETLIPPDPVMFPVDDAPKETFTEEVPSLPTIESTLISDDAEAKSGMILSFLSDYTKSNCF